MKSKFVKAILSLSLLGSVAGTIFIGNAKADVFSYKRDHGGIFSAWYDSSVASYGYTGSYDVGRSSWGGLVRRTLLVKLHHLMVKALMSTTLVLLFRCKYCL